MRLLGGGAVLAGMMLGAIDAFIINRNFKMATVYSLGAAMLAFFGVMRGEKLGLAQSWEVALGYALLGGLCRLMAQREPAAAPAARMAAAKAGASR